MGYPIQVHAWARLNDDGYQWVTVYEGRNWFAAIRAAISVKRNVGCVRIEWRG